jgi:hypothetical protein
MLKNLPSHALTVVLTLAVAGAGSYVYHQRSAAGPGATVALKASDPVEASSQSASGDDPQGPALMVTQTLQTAAPSTGATGPGGPSPDTVTQLNPYAPVYAPPPGAENASPWSTVYAAPAAASAQPQAISGADLAPGGVISIPPAIPASGPPALAYAPNAVYAAPAPAPDTAYYGGVYGGGVAVGFQTGRTRQTKATYLDSNVFTGAPFAPTAVPTNAPIVPIGPATTVTTSGTNSGTNSNQNGSGVHKH